MSAYSGLAQENKRLREWLDVLGRHEINRSLRKGDALTVLYNAPPRAPSWRRPWYLVLAGLAWFLVGCEPAPCEQQWGYFGCSFDRYHVTNPETTPSGIEVDRGGQDVSLEALDAAATAVTDCLATLPEDVPKGQRPGTAFSIVVAPDWETSCTGEQVLPVPVAEAGCLAKGQEQSCQCRYRAGIACPGTLVVTPNLKLLGDVMVRYLRDLDNPWKDPRLVACAGLTAQD